MILQIYIIGFFAMFLFWTLTIKYHKDGESIAKDQSVNEGVFIVIFCSVFWPFMLFFMLQDYYQQRRKRKKHE